MSNYNTQLQSNNTDLQAILNTINTLPEAGTGSTELPELTNPAVASEIFSGKQAINQNGSAITGTFTIDSEISEQETLLAELQTVLAGKAAGGESNSGSNNAGEWTCVASLPTTLVVNEGTEQRYIELENNVSYVLFASYPNASIPLEVFMVCWVKTSLTSVTTTFTTIGTAAFTVNDVSTEDTKILELDWLDSDTANAFYFLPIYNKS